MKKHIIAFNIAAVLALVLMLMPGCTETRWDLAEDYDFSAIEPAVNGLSGPAIVAASGLSAVRYTVHARTGSTYAWTVTGASATVEAVSGYPGYADITYAQSSVDINDVVVKVVETTSGGKTAEAQMTVDLTAFCPLVDMNDLAGTWEGTDSEGFATQVVTSVVDGDFLIEGLNRGWMVEYWGETIEEYIPLVVTMSPDGTLDIARQYVMTTLWNGAPYRYEIAGSGRWDNCLKTLYIEYSLYYEGDGGSTVDVVEDITLVTP